MRFSEVVPIRGRWPASSVLVGCVLFALACGHGGNAFTTNGSDPQLGDSVAVRVVNDNYYSARVRAIYEGGGRFIIGTVESHNGGDDFMIPWQPKPLLFEIDLIIGPGLYLSDRVHVVPGDQVELQLPHDLEQSGFFRRLRG